MGRAGRLGGMRRLRAFGRRLAGVRGHRRGAAYLKRHYKLVILSNVDNESFSLSNKKLGVAFDAVFTAEDIGSYKPSPRNFEYMLEKLDGYGIKKSEILHTAESMFHDHKPANDFGLASCWIHRRHDASGFGATMNPGAMPRYDFRFTSMAEMAKGHRDAVGRGLVAGKCRPVVAGNAYSVTICAGSPVIDDVSSSFRAGTMLA